ncbi:DUF1648 domain-containing protein [Hymenobacter setariae]|uniref:DUF1648 domain-containing protein n=1 Tax=Hymenobacter setariae TaxID=2594794 RepID=A0A558C387_9BACT|nr:SdpI family protein [Hymenobacter setariae]TVT43275.1 DUF1648 domain-containing protein [Hymenobacter setariae]
MKRSLSIWHLLSFLVLVLPTLYLIWAWPALPSRIPSHFGIGSIDNYTSRSHVWLLTSALPIGTYLILTFLPRFDPRRRLAADSRSFHKLSLLLVAGLSASACYCLYLALHPEQLPDWKMGAGISLFLALVGNYLTTVQPNYFLGIRTPWALESDIVWLKTHRLVGRLLFGGGLGLLALAVLGPLTWFEPALLLVVLGIVGLSYGYSYWLYQQLLASNT